LLRCNWGAVEGIAGLLMRLGTLTEPHGMELARMKLREEPMRQLVPDLETFGRLLNGIQRVPELAEPLERALREMQPPAKRAKSTSGARRVSLGEHLVAKREAANGRKGKASPRTYARTSAARL
jgi:hypothetical protein